MNGKKYKQWKNFKKSGAYLINTYLMVSIFSIIDFMMVTLAIINHVKSKKIEKDAL